MLEDPAEVVEAARKSYGSLAVSPLLLVLAAIFWPLEIASRRLLIPAAAAWLPVAARRRVDAETHGRGDGGTRRRGDGETRREKEVAPPPAARTTERLLERKKALREKGKTRY